MKDFIYLFWVRPNMIAWPHKFSIPQIGKSNSHRGRMHFPFIKKEVELPILCNLSSPKSIKTKTTSNALCM
jgi:hypothetical protein